MARAKHVNLQLRTWTQRNLQPYSQPPKCMVLKTVSAANEVPGYTQLQQQIHDALRAQHPEWVQPNGDSPTRDAYEWRFAELLRIRARDSATKNAPEITNSAARLARASFFARGHVPPQAPQPERDANDKFT